MAKFPEPPPASALAALRPELCILPAGTELWRIYHRGGPYGSPWNSFRTYGPVRTSRFDHHRPPPHTQDRGIMYAARSIVTCLAEFFQADRAIDVFDRDPWLVGFALAADLSLLSLRGAWPTAAGGSMEINAGPRPRAQRWSAAIYAAYDEIQGLWYSSSMHANQPAVALYERAFGAIPDAPFFHRSLADPALFTRLHSAAGKLRYRLP